MADSIFKEWVSVTNWHGVADIFRARTCISKFIWICVLVGTTFLFCYEVSLHFQQFLSSGNRPWIESITPEISYSLQLPIVTACSANLVSVKSLQALNMNVQAASYIVGIYREVYDTEMGVIAQTEIYSNNTVMHAEFVNYLDMHPDMKGLSLYDWMLLLGPNCTSVLRMHMYINHQEKHLLGNEYALEMWIYLPKEDYAPINDSRGFDLGAWLHIGFDAVGTVFGPGWGIAPGQHIWMAMEMVKQKEPDTAMLPIFDFAVGPWPCEKNQKAEIVDTADYSQQLCGMDCMHVESLEQCGCIPYASFPVRNSGKYHRCDIQETIACSRLLSVDLSHQCEQKCTLSASACNHNYVSYEVTSLPFPADPKNRARNLQRYFGEDYDEHNVTHWAIANIFYQRMVTKVSKYQLRTSVEDLISNVGGQLGLWAGISIITVYQAFVYAISALIQCLPPRTKQKHEPI